MIPRLLTREKRTIEDSSKQAAFLPPNNEMYFERMTKNLSFP
jgi:hypothetical protein